VPPTQQRLWAKRMLVTGASRGIGAGIARTLAKEGARIALTYSHQKAAAEQVLGELQGEGHIVIQMDVADSASIEQGFNQVVDAFGSLDGLVNNAGITKDQLLLRMKEEDFDSVLTTNLRGAFLCCKQALKIMLRQRHGSVVNISSVVGQMGNPGQTNYAASKAGLEGLTRALSLEVASRQIRINAVAPGFIETDMTKAMDAKQQEAMQSRIPMGRLGSADDVAHAVSYLLSDDSAYMTGQVLHVNGGLYM
jgi:3-oxoacyl-[acyl-carrier protein] reductase